MTNQMIPKSAKMTQNNPRITTKAQLEDAILRFVLRHRTAFQRIFHFIDMIPYRLIGIVFVWLGVKFAEVGANAINLIDKDVGFLAFIMIPVGIFFILRNWRKI